MRKIINQILDLLALACFAFVMLIGIAQQFERRDAPREGSSTVSLRGSEP